MGSRPLSWFRISLRIGVGGALCANFLFLPLGRVPQAEAAAATAVYLIPEVLSSASVTAPASVNLGSATPGGTMNVQLGQVKVTSSGVMRWTATVSATNFTTGGGSAAETIARGNLSYWSGPVVSKSGPGTFSPGQPTAAGKVALDTARTAFSYGSVSSSNTSCVWQPTLVMSVPASAVAGTYTGTVTHSVA
ncbi:hypothetical protein N8I84_20290 [Streptomyces cynarae]|uniref:WxL domain-containing protein n=1 Tax=Streptomyces cynarae TaxID=2981134 RepID=A0ABY6E6E7_9ACTN|nr:hypothetical protein [Streptomyces cynarae]UXY20781.1 hypothetical protein N8I84_20290 [Streptomyces cynarae]